MSIQPTQNAEIIKKSLMCIQQDVDSCIALGPCNKCRYNTGNYSIIDTAHDTLAYIHELESRLAYAEKQIDELKSEQCNLICDFMDYVNAGFMRNAAPFCAFHESCMALDDKGRCNHWSSLCNGFVPILRHDRESLDDTGDSAYEKT